MMELKCNLYKPEHTVHIVKHGGDSIVLQGIFFFKRTESLWEDEWS